MFLQHGSRTEMSPPGLNTGQVLGKLLFCADRFHRRNIQNPKPKEECMGIKVNIWNRARVHRYYLDEIR